MSPRAVQTFGELENRWYTCTRDNSAPGSGVWSTPVKILDITDPTIDAAFDGASAGDDPAHFGLIGDYYDFNTSGVKFIGNGGTATFIVTPDVPDQTAYSLVNSNWGAAEGSWYYGGAYWVLLANNFAGTLSMLKSTDGGATWIQVDNTNAPLPGGGNPRGGYACFRRRPGTSFIDFAYRIADSGGESFLTLNTFDFSASGGVGAWGGAYGSLDCGALNGVFSRTVSFSGADAQCFDNIVYFPNGDIGLLPVLETGDGVSGAFPATESVYYIVFSAGAWGAPISINSEIFYQATLIDPSGTLLYVLTQRTSVGINVQTVTQGGAVSSALFTFPGISNSDGIGGYQITNNKIFLPLGDLDGGGPNTVWVSTLGTINFLPEQLPLPPGEDNVLGALGAPIVNNGGANYMTGDTGYVTGGINRAYFTVNVPGGGPGAVNSVLMDSDGGGGYTSGTNVPTTGAGAQPGIGTGLTLDITAGPNLPSCCYMLPPLSSPSGSYIRTLRMNNKPVTGFMLG